MKKRILALALAGTTAFSVFGAAMSASAGTATVDPSTHVLYENDAYESITVADTIHVTYTGSVTEYKILDKNQPTMSWSTETYTNAEIDEYVAGQEISDAYTADILYSLWVSEGGIRVNKDGKKATIDDGKVTYSEPVEAEVAKAMTEFGIQKYKGTGSAVEYIVVKDGKTVYSADRLSDALAYGIKNYKGTLWSGHFDTRAKADAEAEYIADSTYTNLPDATEYKAKIEKEAVATASTPADGDVVVSPSIGDFRSWTFSANLDGSEYGYDEDGKPVVYAYDFTRNYFYGDVEDIEDAWNDTDYSETKVASIINPYNGDQTLKAETGYGIKGSLREEVVDEWMDFLDSLAIHDNALDPGDFEEEDEFISMYSDRLYSRPLYSPVTGQQIGSYKTDLYKIKELLKDIYGLNSTKDYLDANTSELIYLMKMYDKYIGNYIEKSEVSSDEWGDLLVSLLEATDSSDFKTVQKYNVYMNKAEDAIEAYEAAETSAMQDKAILGMYNLLTASTEGKDADATELQATMGSLFFNEKALPKTLTEGSYKYGNAKYTNYGYSGGQLGGYWSLYPMADYAQKGNVNSVYTGNTNDDVYFATSEYGYDMNYSFKLDEKTWTWTWTTTPGTAYTESTDEYQWLWNVYQLAYKMQNNKKDAYRQGQIDAVNDALVKAIDALTVTTTPMNSDVVELEEVMAAYDGKIASDYVEARYGMYTDAYDYAENIAEGKYQIEIATAIVAVTGDDLEHQANQVTITKNMIKDLQTAISDGKAAVENIKNSDAYNAAQVTNLNKAISKAEDLVKLYEGTLYDMPNWFNARGTQYKQSVNKDGWTGLVGDKDQMVVSDINAAIEGIEAAIKGGSVVQGWSKNEDGAWQYGKDDAYFQDGWMQDGSTWYYFEKGVAVQSDWRKVDGKWYYMGANCGAAIGWKKVDGTWYYFDRSCAMKTGWLQTDGNWYYLKPSGAMATGWQTINGKSYYFSEKDNEYGGFALGQMLYNTTTPDGYKVGADGAWVK